MTTAETSVAFVGLGYATQVLHLPAVRALEGASIVGGADPDAERRRQWTGLGAGPAFHSFETLLERTLPSLVVVATPPDSHGQLCQLALRAGADVLCEKPFVETLAQADTMLSVAEEQGRRVAVNHEFRHMPIFSALQREVGAPGVGRAVFVSCTQFMDLPPWKEPVAWRAAMPNRSLFEAGVHLVDLMALVTGRLPQWVTAHTSSGLDLSRQADAVHLVTFDYGDGLLAQLTIDRLCRAGTRYVDLRVDCEHASLRASYGGRAYLQIGVKRAQRPGIRVDYGPQGLAWSETGERRRVLARNPRQAATRATAALLADTVASWRAGREPATSGRAARDVMRVVEASYRSAESGERVALDEV